MRNAEMTRILWTVRMLVLRVRVLWSIAIRRIRGYGSYVRERNALRLAKERHQHERSENDTLHRDGNCQGAAAKASLTSALFGIAIHQTTAQVNQGRLRRLLRRLFRARETSHTSTKFSAGAGDSAVLRDRSAEFLRRRYPGGCSKSPGDRRRARRDVRLRASSLRWTPRAGTSSPCT